MRGSTCRETRNVALGRRIAQHQHTSHTGHRQSADKAAHLITVILATVTSAGTTYVPVAVIGG